MIARGAARIAALLAALTLAACGKSAGPPADAPAPIAAPTFHADANPQRLSEWGMLRAADGELTLGARVLAYDLNTPLFTDYAQKLRTIWMPEGLTAGYEDTATLDFPVGTVITKTFYYPRGDGESVVEGGAPEAPGGETLDLSDMRLIETRVLVHRADGWVALPYVWDDDQRDARLMRIGATAKLTLARADGRRDDFTYIVPDANQCAGCHATDNTAHWFASGTM